MSAPLNELLRQYIQNSGYTVYYIASASKINRTTLQHILKGNRFISRDNLDRLIPFLKLTPMEKEKLESAYIIQQLGQEICEKNLIIKKMLEMIPCGQPTRGTTVPVPAASVSQMQQVNGYINIISVICQLISADIKMEKTPYFCAVAPFYHSFFTNLYKEFTNPYFHSLQCSHLIPFAKDSAAIPSASLYNLKNFAGFFPFIIRTVPNIKFYHYYELTGACPSPIGMPFPYYILLSHNTILLSRDFTNACILPESNIGYFQNHMQGLLDSAYPLLENSAPALIESDGFPVENISFSCSINAPEFMLNGFLEKTSTAYVAFSQSQYDTFVNDGTLPGSFGEADRTFTVNERINILNHMSECNQQSAHQFFILKPNIFSPHISFVTYDNSVSFCAKSADGSEAFFLLKETDIVLSLNEFVKNLPLYQYAYSAEDSIKIFERSAKELERKITALP